MKTKIFIVGAPKCATTSLHRYLDKHPGVFMSNPKETNFFSSEEILQQGLFYGESIVTTTEEYSKIFSEAAPGQIPGEASVSYLYYPETPRKIKEYNPEAKIIIILRNPTQRTFSHYLMDVRLGYCQTKLEEITKSPHKHQLHFQQYIELSLYHNQINRYLETFGKENVFIALDEDLSRNADETLIKLCEFIGIDYIPEMNTSRRHNSYKEPSSPLVAFLYKSGNFRRKLQKILPKKANDLLKRILFKEAEKPKISDDLKKQLDLTFKEDIKKTASLIERDLSHWVSAS